MYYSIAGGGGVSLLLLLLLLRYFLMDFVMYIGIMSVNSKEPTKKPLILYRQKWCISAVTENFPLFSFCYCFWFVCLVVFILFCCCFCFYFILFVCVFNLIFDGCSCWYIIGWFGCLAPASPSLYIRYR